ncbi:YeiH family protein [Psychrobacter lutiphocae]|uniref:YeiH family protein n=1 Tax=Psychrobacter lutiphocae TaxID=540500 RepID=UPI000382B859|nr:YeiH family protein [Psychrobacter lutiphocae]
MRAYHAPFKTDATQHINKNRTSNRLSLPALLDKILGDYLPKRTHLLGLLLVLLGSLTSIWLNDRIQMWTDGKLLGLSSLTLAILIGMVLGNSVYPKLSATLSSGVTFSKGQILRLAIVLYGFKITLTQVASVGLSAVAIDALVLTSTFTLTYILGTKWLKMDRSTTMLIGSGASICGAAAVIAAEPVVKAESHKVTIAVATVVVFGTLSMLLYPLFYQLGWFAGLLDAQQYGAYIGSTIHEVAQVVVAGNAISSEVGNTAVVTKMIRVMMLAPFLLILSIFITANTDSDNTVKVKNQAKNNTENHTISFDTKFNAQNSLAKTPFLSRLKQIHIPWFAFVFISMVAINSLLTAYTTPMITTFTGLMIDLDNLLLTMAMFALGLTTHLSAIKQASVKPLILASIMFIWLIVGGAMINIVVSMFSS